MHDVREFVQVPTLGEHVVTSPTSPRFKVYRVVHYGFLGSEFQAEV